MTRAVRLLAFAAFLTSLMRAALVCAEDEVAGFSVARMFDRLHGVHVGRRLTLEHYWAMRRERAQAYWFDELLKRQQG